MAEVYKSVGGKPIEEFIAENDGVQASLTVHAREVYSRARALRAGHYHEGHAEIEYASGDVDRYVVLSDVRGQKAAMSIEFGRGPGDGPGDPFPNGTVGTWILHRASGLARKSVRPNSRRKKKYRPNNTGR